MDDVRFTQVLQLMPRAGSASGSFCQGLFLPTCLSVCPSVCLDAHLSVCPPICLPACLSTHLSVSMPICLFVRPSVSLPICLSVCLLICLSACLSASQSLWLLFIARTGELSVLAWDRYDVGLVIPQTYLGQRQT